jgi:hypothetical protein
VRDARGETRPPAQSRARATYKSDVSVTLLFSASESAAAPAPLIWVVHRLQREEEGQSCSWRDRAAGTEPGARDLPKRHQQAQCIRKLVTIPPAFELFNHNVHLCAASQAASNVRSLKTPRSTELDAASADPRARPSSPLLACSAPETSASVFFTLRPRQDAQTSIALHVHDSMVVE